jgi:WD40 repeat protein
MSCGYSSAALWCVQIEPLADYHVGPITGICSSPDGQHLISCGLDGSVHIWAAAAAAAAAGQLVGKQDLGGKLTCCAVALGAADMPSKPVMAVGSEAGVLRWASDNRTRALACMKQQVETPACNTMRCVLLHSTPIPICKAANT